jgi:hypothetical protein
VQGGEHEVARLGGFERDLYRLAVAHLADEDDLRGLAQGGAQGAREVGRVRAELALVNRRVLVDVEELYRVLDGDDVVILRLVDQVDDGRQRGALAGAGRPRHEDDAVLQLGDVPELLR